MRTKRLRVIFNLCVLSEIRARDQDNTLTVLPQPLAGTDKWIDIPGAADGAKNDRAFATAHR